MSSHRPISTALLSYGMSGEVFHAPLLDAHAGFTMKTVLQRAKTTATLHYPYVQVVKNLNKILRDPEIELVIVNTPNATHFDFASRALEAGKHVVVEKPFTNTSRDAAKLIALAKKKKRILTVFQSRRWDGAFMTLKKVIDLGVLGPIVEYEAHYDRFRNYVVAGSWKEKPVPGAGILYNLGSHMLDQVLVLFGKPSYVTAKTGVQRPGAKVDDFYDIRLEYPGLHVIVKSSYLVREPGPLYRVNGVLGSFVLLGIDPQEEALKLHQRPGAAGWGEEPSSYWGLLNTEIGGVHVEGTIETLAGNYLGFYQNLFEAIREKKALAVKPEQSMEVIRMIETAIESSQKRRSIAF